jgi:hypothetical protein
VYIFHSFEFIIIFCLFCLFLSFPLALVCLYISRPFRHFHTSSSTSTTTKPSPFQAIELVIPFTFHLLSPPDRQSTYSLVVVCYCQLFERFPTHSPIAPVPRFHNSAPLRSRSQKKFVGGSTTCISTPTTSIRNVIQVLLALFVTFTRQRLTW